MAINEATHGEMLERATPTEVGMTIDETVGGLALIALGIVALARIYPGLIDSINVVVAGVALLFMTISLSSELARVYSRPSRDLVDTEIGSGLSAGVMAGIAGIVLGILSILDIARPTLIAVAVIVFGAAVLLDFAMMAQTRSVRNAATASAESARFAPAPAGSAMASIFVGVGLVTLGIIAVVGVRPDILVAVSLLGLGGYLFLKGTAIVAYIVSWAV